LCADWAKEGGFATGKKIKVAASRNPSGHYSDNAGGKMIGEYEVDCASFKALERV